MGKFLNVGLTGGIACGKSLVSSMFKALGAATLDSDAIYHSLIEPGNKLHKKLISTFGEDILNQQGGIDRKKLGSLVFSNPEARKQLNSIAHPLVIKEQKRIRKEIIKEWKSQSRDQGIIITDAALMIEAGTYKTYDKLVVVYSDYEIQIQRLVKNRGLAKEQAEKRLESQMSAAEKKNYADFVIVNNSTVEELITQVELVYYHLCELTR